MTITNNGARFPGPLGTVTGNWNGRIPGPLDFKVVDLSKSATKATTKVLAMPPPTSGSSSIIRARAVDWDLAPKAPVPEDVLQGELANCPVAAILAALANTATGKKRIDSMITEFKGGSVKTTFTANILKTLSAKTKDDPDYKPPVGEILSKRSFSVDIGYSSEISDVFYVQYSDGTDVTMVYMGSPNKSLWPCVIEKAFAAKIGSYEELDDDKKHKVDEFWPALVGSKLQGFAVDEKTDLKKIIDAATAARQVPTIGASRDDATRVLDHHGFAILGMQGKNIELYDPHGKRDKLTPEEFRKSFQRIYFGNP